MHRSFGHREVLSDFNLVAQAGTRVALTGPNGSGKSTLLRCISGSVRPSRGQISIEGHPAGTVQAKNRIGVSLSQERSFYMRLTGLQNLLYWARLRRLPTGMSPRDHVTEVIKELEMTDIAAKRVDRCSTGMVQQLTFARALLGDPPLLLLDEPTRSLDKEAVGRLWAALDRRPAAAVLLATHRAEDIERCDSVFELG